MEDPLQRLREIMLISGVTCAGVGLLLLLLTVWRSHWKRLLNAEEAFWKKLGIKGRWLGSLRRFEESKVVIPLVAALFALHLVLLATSAGAYAYFSPRLHKKRSSPAQTVPKQPPPTRQKRP